MCPVSLSRHRSDGSRGCHLRLLCHALTEVSGREGGVSLRYHPCRQIRHKVQAFQCHDTCRHQVAGGEKRVLQVGGHRLLARRYCRQVLHLNAQHDVEQEQYIKANEV